ncbi:membrane protein [Mycoplasma feriruminatoris]|uniref:aromatic motif membrane protein n=1 Tax=Mycoplasma feriruminatoris TaxID=1179777 RepID=UPI00241CEFD0|nr:aromatic motif membrane protein [Mycoplasma feriruminatoris]WFQ91378.1 membrane protein [Mycoplasma feriruminatoris]WFQ96375.1 membrane protein [Mycoplasma feriruminatoris]
MLTLKKSLQAILLSLFPVFSLTAISCSNKNLNITNLSIKKDEKKDSWDQFVQREYVNQILNIAFDNDQEKIKKYKEDQFNINDNQMLSTLNKYLTYANNINAGYGNDGDSIVGGDPYPTKEYGNKLTTFFNENWLWTLFNLDKFNFVLYDVYNGFDGNVTKLGEDAEKNAIDYGLFKQIHSNNISQFVLTKSNSIAGKLVYYNFYLLTEDWNILEINIEKNPDKFKFIAYTNIYPKLTKNKLDREVFILDEYANAVLSVAKDRTSQAMNNFNAKFGGKPLRYVMFEVNSKYLEK